jgi:hypothetical protein
MYFIEEWCLLGCYVLTRATRRNNPEDTILHSHRRENLKSYNVLYYIYLQPGRATDVLFSDLSLYPKHCDRAENGCTVELYEN